MLIMSTFYYRNFQQKALIINTLLRLCMSTFAYAYALVKTTPAFYRSHENTQVRHYCCDFFYLKNTHESLIHNQQQNLGITRLCFELFIAWLI